MQSILYQYKGIQKHSFSYFYATKNRKSSPAVGFLFKASIGYSWIDGIRNLLIIFSTTFFPCTDLSTRLMKFLLEIRHSFKFRVIFTHCKSFTEAEKKNLLQFQESKVTKNVQISLLVKIKDITKKYLLVTIWKKKQNFPREFLWWMLGYD